MPQIDTQLRNFDKQVLQLPIEKREKYLGKATNYLADLKWKIQSRGKLRVNEPVIAGSLVKRTNLQFIDRKPVDVDSYLFVAKQQNEKVKDLLGESQQ